MLGYGSEYVFYGWIILNRFELNGVYDYGNPMKCLAMGVLTINSSSATVSGKAANGLTLSASKGSGNVATVTLSRHAFASVNDVHVQLTPKSSETAYVSSVATNSFTVTATGNGSFFFMLYNMSGF